MGGGLGEISLYYSRSWISLYILKYASVNNLQLQLHKPKTQPMPRSDIPKWERLHHPPPPHGNWQKTPNCSNIWGQVPHFRRWRQSESWLSCFVLDEKLLISAFVSMLKGCFHRTFMRFSPLFVPQHHQAWPVHLT